MAVWPLGRCIVCAGGRGLALTCSAALCHLIVKTPLGGKWRLFNYPKNKSHVKIKKLDVDSLAKNIFGMQQ